LRELISITSAVSVHRGQIVHNGKLVFEEKEASAGQFLLSAYKYTGAAYPKFYKMDGLCKLGWIAAEYLLKDKSANSLIQDFSTGIVLANRNSSLDADLKYHQTVSSIPSPALFVYTLPNIVIGEISIRHKIKGENAFFIQDAFDAVFMEQYVRILLNNDKLQSCICGWADFLADDYKAVLMLVEKNKAGIEFNAQNMLTYF